MKHRGWSLHHRTYLYLQISFTQPPNDFMSGKTGCEISSRLFTPGAQQTAVLSPPCLVSLFPTVSSPCCTVGVLWRVVSRATTVLACDALPTTVCPLSLSPSRWSYLRVMAAKTKLHSSCQDSSSQLPHPRSTDWALFTPALLPRRREAEAGLCAVVDLFCFSSRIVSEPPAPNPIERFAPPSALTRCAAKASCGRPATKITAGLEHSNIQTLITDLQQS